MANKLAKKNPTSHGVMVLAHEEQIKEALQLFPVEDLWGIGRAKAKTLHGMGVKTAFDFTKLPGEWVKKHFTITGFRMWRELHGFSCMDEPAKDRKKEAIATGRSFGKLQVHFDDVSEAIANHAASCAEKLRKQKSLAGYLDVQIETSRFRTELPQYAQHITLKLTPATNDSIIIVKKALEGLKQIWKAGYFYNRCGVLLMDLRDAESGKQEVMFEKQDWAKSEKLMQTLDAINKQYGKNTLKLASQGDGKKWALRRAYLSPRYLTRLKEFIALKS
jgi:DNA polymerase V